MKMVFKRSQDSDELHKVQTIAQNTNVLVSQSMISKVELAESSDEKDRGKEKDATFDLKIHLTKDGKNRLWKFSSDGGTQVIVVCKGVAIASATIGTQLNSEELIIKQIADKGLVEQAVSLIQFKE